MIHVVFLHTCGIVINFDWCTLPSIGLSLSTSFFFCLTNLCSSVFFPKLPHLQKKSPCLHGGILVFRCVHLCVCVCPCACVYGCVSAMRKRDILFRSAKSSGKSSSDRIKYNKKRNQVVEMIRDSKESYFNNNLNGVDAKSFWKTVRILNTNGISSIPTLSVGSSVAETSHAKAAALNNYFYKCFNHEQPPLSETQTEFMYTSLSSSNCPSELLCTEESVLEMLMELDTTKSTGNDGISPKMLKCSSAGIAHTICNLFNLSIATGTFPTEWKTGRITPIPKGTNSSHPSGYRPISVLPAISKLIEHHIKSIIESFLNSNSPISSRQWGFMSKRSTVSALIRVVEDWLLALDQGLEICVVFFDVSKAFDTVPHLDLLRKLSELGLNPNLIRWIKSYLCERSQYVTVEGISSHTLPVASGVPQGSVLGPLLFILYLNDVVNTVSAGSNLNMFADDIAMYRVIRTATDYMLMQRDVHSISECIKLKRLQFNANKCKMMLITRKKSNSLPPPPIMLDGTELKRVHSYKYLGITLTSNMSWSPHITVCCNKTRRLIGLLYRRFHQHSSSSTLIKLYCSFIRPHLEYASVVWNPGLKGENNALENVQKFALRVCTNLWDLSYDKLLVKTRLPSLKDRRTRASLCHLFKIMHGLTEFADAPVHLMTFIHDTRSSNKTTICPLQPRTRLYQCSFFPTIISIWNNLPKEATQCKTLASFKNFILSM